jgi:hypothetical protein
MPLISKFQSQIILKKYQIVLKIIYNFFALFFFFPPNYFIVFIRVGGITKARIIRDLSVASGIPLNIEDTWGGDIVTAAIAHLAHSTPPELLLCSTDFNSYGPKRIAGYSIYSYF